MIEEWKNEPNEEFWIEGDTPCFATRTSFSGVWCAYCAVPKESSLYAKEHSYSVSMSEEMKNRPVVIDELGILNLVLASPIEEGPATMEVLVRCHGGLTFSGERKFPAIPEEYHSWWWFGFDCCHAWDHAPINMSGSYEAWSIENNIYRTLPYVKECVTKMIQDLQTIEGII